MKERRQTPIDSAITAAVHRGYLYTAVMALLGIVLLIWPKEAVSFAYFAAAIIIILLGMWRVVRYFREDQDTAREKQLLTGGALRMILGALMLLYNTDVRSDWLQAICGAALLVIGSVRLQAAFDLRRRDHGNWYIPLSISVMSLVLGIVALLSSQANVLLMLGIALCVDAVTDLYCRLSMSSYERQQRKEAQAAVLAAAQPASTPAYEPAEEQPEKKVAE